MYNAFGLVHGLGRAHRRRQRRRGHRPRHRRGQARGGHGGAHRRAGHAGQGHALLVRAAVADRRVLHLLRAGGAADSGGRRRRRPTAGHPRQPRRADGPDGPRPEHAARAVPRAPGAAHQRVRDRARGQPGEPQRGDPARRPGADPAPQGDPDPGQPERDHPRPQRELRPGHRPARRAPPGRRQLHQEGPRHRRGLRRAPRGPVAATSSLLDDFLAELRPTLAELDNLAVKQTPLLTDLRAAAPGLNRLALNLPAFNGATEASLRQPGRRVAGGREGAAPGGRRDRGRSPQPARRRP